MCAAEPSSRGTSPLGSARRATGEAGNGAVTGHRAATVRHIGGRCPLANFVMIPIPTRVRAQPEAATLALLRWVRRPAGAPVLICFPHAGGSVLSCLGLAAALPAELAIATVALPGHAPDVPEAPVADARHLAARVAEEIAADLGADLAPQGAGLTLLGNSFGALLAFETALALERADAARASRLHLVVSGFRSPSRPPFEAPLHRLPLAVLLAELRECFGAIGPDLGDLIGAHEEAALRADLEACETYRLGDAAPLRCAASVIRLTADPSVSVAECEAWREVCAGPVGFHALEAGHFPWSGATAAFARLVGELVAFARPVAAVTTLAGRSALSLPVRES